MKKLRVLGFLVQLLGLRGQGVAVSVKVSGFGISRSGFTVSGLAGRPPT